MDRSYCQPKRDLGIITVQIRSILIICARPVTHVFWLAHKRERLIVQMSPQGERRNVS